MARIELFRDENYLGGSIILTDSNEDLAVLGFNDAVSSVVVYSGTFTFFQNRAFEGFSFTVSRTGGPDSDGRYPTPQTLAGRDNVVSSVRVNSEEPTGPW